MAWRCARATSILRCARAQPSNIRCTAPSRSGSTCRSTRYCAGRPTTSVRRTYWTCRCCRYRWGSCWPHESCNPRRRWGTLGVVRLSVVKPLPEDETALIAACVRGERAAERALFRREYPRVNATVFRLVGSSRDADDLVQETFIAAFRALPKFRGESKLSTWIDR